MTCEIPRQCARMAWQGVIDRLDDLRAPRPSSAHGQVAEWLKAHAWNACIGETLSRVRIPLCPPLPATQCPEIQHFSAWILAAAQAGPSPGPPFRSDPACASVTRQFCHLWRSGPRRSMWLPAGLSVVAPLGVAIPGTAAGDQLPVSGPGCGSPMGRGSARRDRRTGRSGQATADWRREASSVVGGSSLMA